MRKAEVEKWAANEVTMLPLSQLTAAAVNPRMHSKEQIEAVVHSIREWGWTMPILIDEQNTIIAGHGRAQAARMLKLKQVPCLIARDWSEEQKQAYLIADNKLTDNSGFDDLMLAESMKSLDDLGFALEKTGFCQPELESLWELLNPAGADDPSEHWGGMPEFENDDLMPERSITVHFENDVDVQAFANLIGQEFTDKTKSVWYPKHERENLAAKQYTESEGEE